MATHRVVAVLDLELVPELVRSARSTHAWSPKILGEQSEDDILLVRGKVGRIGRGDHVQTGDATAADELHLHEDSLTATALGSSKLEISTTSVSGPGP
jgi:hypothetical protein